jgi:hypothetical protein
LCAPFCSENFSTANNVIEHLKINHKVFRGTSSQKVKIDSESSTSLQTKAATVYSKFYAQPEVTQDIIQLKIKFMENVANFAVMKEYRMSIVDTLARVNCLFMKWRV